MHGGRDAGLTQEGNVEEEGVAARVRVRVGGFFSLRWNECVGQGQKDGCVWGTRVYSSHDSAAG